MTKKETAEFKVRMKVKCVRNCELSPFHNKVGRVVEVDEGVVMVSFEEYNEIVRFGQRDSLEIVARFPTLFDLATMPKK